MEKLEDIRRSYHEKLAMLELVKAGVRVDKAPDYVKYINVDDEAGVVTQAQSIAGDVSNETSNAKVKTNNTWNLFE